MKLVLPTNFLHLLGLLYVVLKCFQRVSQNIGKCSWKPNVWHLRPLAWYSLAFSKLPDLPHPIYWLPSWFRHEFYSLPAKCFISDLATSTSTALDCEPTCSWTRGNSTIWSRELSCSKFFFLNLRVPAVDNFIFNIDCSGLSFRLSKQVFFILVTDFHKILIETFVFVWFKASQCVRLKLNFVSGKELNMFSLQISRNIVFFSSVVSYYGSCKIIF